MTMLNITHPLAIVTSISATSQWYTRIGIATKMMTVKPVQCILLYASVHLGTITRRCPGCVKFYRQMFTKAYKTNAIGTKSLGLQEI